MVEIEICTDLWLCSIPDRQAAVSRIDSQSYLDKD
jgi:hypothetical protein